MCDCAIIIPTHNRHSYLKRSIEYFKNIDANIIYIDSSDSSFSGEIYSNIKYFHTPTKTFPEKILYALEQIESSYIALCADDDFIIIDTLYKGVQCLEKEKSISTIIGNNLGFHENFDGKFYHDTTFKFTTPLVFLQKNVKSFFNNYRQILWGLYRKPILEKSFKMILCSKFQNDNFIELVLGGICCDQGGIMILNEIWSVRELSAKEHWGDKHKSIAEYYFKNSSKTDFKNFYKNFDHVTSQGYAKKILFAYLNMSKTTFVKMKLKYLIINIIKYFYNSTPKHYVYNNSYEKYTNLKMYDPKFSEFKQLEDITKILKYYSE
jgi:glycosyltransferase domain-containing protein